MKNSNLSAAIQNIYESPVHLVNFSRLGRIATSPVSLDSGVGGMDSRTAWYQEAEYSESFPYGVAALF